jgi:ribose transport system ATP-binding protein
MAEPSNPMNSRERLAVGGGRSDDRPPLLRVEHVHKTFGGERALVDAHFSLRRGEIRGLVGANGSGKSTLIKILAGYEAPDDRPAPTILLDGRPVEPARAGGLEGFRFIHQDLALVPEFSVAENLALIWSVKAVQPLVRKRRDHERYVRSLLEKYAVSVQPSTPVGSLPLAERTLVAVMAALGRPDDEVRGLVLDETTATLPVDEVEKLATTVKQLAAGGVGVVVVSHRTEEMLGLCDSVTVLRDGRVVAERSVGGLDARGLLHLITGAEPQELFPDITGRVGKPLLMCDELRGGPLAGVSLEVAAGEIVGLASLDSHVSGHVLRVLIGERPMEAGRVLLEGSDISERLSPHVAASLGIAFVTDRLEAGAPMFSVRENLTLGAMSGLARRGYLRRQVECEVADALISGYSVQPSNSALPLASLSGGNQQKVVLARSLRTLPKVLLLDNATRGVDVAAKAVLYKAVESAARRGVAVLMCSTDFDELCGLCRRVFVMRQGATVTEVSGSALAPTELLRRCYS